MEEKKIPPPGGARRPSTLYPRLPGEADHGLDRCGLYGDPGGHDDLLLLYRLHAGEHGPSPGRPRLIGLGILALVSWRTTGRPGKWPAIALAAVCFLAALATLPLGIVGLLSNFSLVGVFVTGAP